MVKQAKQDRLDINSCTEAELGASIPGLGPKTAAALVASRRVQGPFVSLEDVKDRKLRSVGSAKLRALEAARVTFSSTVVAAPSAVPTQSESSQASSNSHGTSKPRPAQKVAKAFKKLFKRASSSDASEVSSTPHRPVLHEAIDLQASTAGPGPLELGASPVYSTPSKQSTNGSTCQPSSVNSSSRLQDRSGLPKPAQNAEASHQILVTTPAVPWWHSAPDAPFPAEFQVSLVLSLKAVCPACDQSILKESASLTHQACLQDPTNKNEHHFDRIAADRSGRLEYRGHYLTPKEAADLRSAWDIR